MKYAAYGLLAAFLALGVYGAIPTTAEGWYTPSGGFSRQSGSGTVWYLDDEGNERSVSVSVDDEGKVTGGMGTIADTTLKTSYEALVKACANEAWNALQDEAIATIGKNLDSVFNADGIQMVMEKQGPGGSTTEATYTLRIQPGSGGGGATIEATDPIPYGLMVDGKSIDWTRQDAQGQLSIRGIGSANGGQIAYANGAGGIVWGYPPAGVLFDDVTVTTNGTGRAHLVGWAGGNECNTTLSDILTEESGGNRSTHCVLTRYGTGNDAVFHYVPMGDRLSFDGVAFDDVSVTTNGTGEAHLVGIEEANEGYIAYADGDGGIEWDESPPSVSYNNEDGILVIFRRGEDAEGEGAQIVLPMIDIEEDENEGGYKFTWRQLDSEELKELTIPYSSGVSFDDKSVTTNGTGKAHIVGVGEANDGQMLYADGDGGVEWKDPPAGVQFDDKTVTTNGTGKAHLVGIENATNRQIAYADGSGGITWGDLGGVQFDDKTITTNETGKAHLVGIENTTEGQIAYSDGDGGITWDNPPAGVQFDDVTVTTNDTGKAHLVGWSGGKDCGTDLSTILTEESDSNRSSHYVLTRYGEGNDAVFHYVPMGDRLDTGGGSPVDCESITTNASEGASSQGDASLYGWSTAQAEDIPQKSDEGTLKWTSPEDMVDGSSLAWTELQGVGKVWEVKDAHVYGGKHAKHYFGTSVDKEAALGWHELPNISTNRVEGDEVTISSDPNIPGQGDDPDVKKIGLKGWNYSLSGEPMFVANNQGMIDYLSLSSLTNLAACACTNKWNALLGWIEDGELDGNNGITFESESLDYYMWHDLGYVYATTPANLHFNNDGNDIEASFDAPKNWADDISIEEADGKYRLKNFENGGGCAANLNDMLTNTVQNCADKGKHQILCRYKNGANDPVVHWLPFPDDALVAGGGSKWTGSFSYFDGVIHSGCVTVGRTPILVSGMSATSGDYRIRVTLGTSPAAVLESGSGFQSPSGNTCYIPVFTLSNGEITADYRGSFVVPAYE